MTAARLTAYSHDGLTFDVLDDGPLDGDPVVLLHGWPERATTWRSVAPLLHARGLRTYAPDQRGYSPGARPLGRWHYRIGRLTADVVALVEEIGRPVHLVGHDWGSIVGWHLAATRPDLVRSWTAVSVPHPRAFVRAAVTSSQGLKSWYMGLFQVPLLVDLVGRFAPTLLLRALREGGMTEEEVRRCRAEILDYGALPGGLGWYRALPFAAGEVGTSEVSVPTTFVWSTEDVALARRGAELTAQHVTGPYEFVELEGVSHWVPTQAPEALAEAVLRRIDSVGAAR
ncbi:alpha/beta fold hydrolase [Nocardioides sp. SYSU D00038]|uniref:alpha/beta fold hydrolase n=1 Tax=Nocardioides sp. SYSU D00038 TaxID=2812554 RepID=UPI0019689047|nr:alpha/beta fold hydrolase [Nocardioides sp. SYSU D00038]